MRPEEERLAFFRPREKGGRDRDAIADALYLHDDGIADDPAYDAVERADHPAILAFARLRFSG